MKNDDNLFQKLCESIRGIHPSEVQINLSGDAKQGYVLHKIIVPEELRGTGEGKKAMKELTERADREGAIIALTPDAFMGSSKSRLVEFFKSFGFVPNKGKNKDFNFMESMIRYPR